MLWVVVTRISIYIDELRLDRELKKYIRHFVRDAITHPYPNGR